MRAPEWFRPLLPWFTWQWSEDLVTIACRRCPEIFYFGAAHDPAEVVYTCCLHRASTRCALLLQDPPPRKV